MCDSHVLPEREAVSSHGSGDERTRPSARDCEHFVRRSSKTCVSILAVRFGSRAAQLELFKYRSRCRSQIGATSVPGIRRLRERSV